MSPAAQRIAIAEACGYYNINSVCWRAWRKETVDGKPAVIERHVPDYLTDLNAMNMAEKIFPHPSSFYQHNLSLVCGGDDRMYHATAAQRAEAFLKTLGLWKEGA